MAPKKRLPQNKRYPTGWRVKNGAFRYRVPIGMEHMWDDRKEFTLGKTETEAYKTWSERLQLAQDATTINDLLDRYVIEEIPNKAASTRKSRTASIGRVRPVFGNMPIDAIKPRHIFKYRDIANKKNGIFQTNHDIELMSHLYTKAVEWGLLDMHPLKGQIEKNSKPKRKRYVEDWEIDESLKAASPVIRAYIELKLLTGLRRGDLLRIKTSDLKDDGIHVTPSKTKDSSGISLIIEWTDELRVAVNAAKKARPKDIAPWLFCTRKGECYYDEEEGSANGFDSLWQRFQKKAIAETSLTEKYQEKDLRKKTASDMTLDEARLLLGHTTAATTKKNYRVKGERVKPHTLKKGKGNV